MDKKELKTIAVFDGDAPFNFFIEKAEVGTNTEDFSIKGVASTSNIDHDGERMDIMALKRMAKIINEKGVPLRVEHQKSNNAIIGMVDKATIDDRNSLIIEAQLDKENPAAIMLHNLLKTGGKMGLSVGGRVKSAVREMAEGAGKMIKTFYDVILDEVSVTPRPSNFDAWLVRKHYKNKEDDVSEFYETPLEKEFYFENSKLDYLMEFEKSIPDQAWRKVEVSENNNNTNDMKIFKTENEKIESTETTKYADMDMKDEKPSDESATKSYVDSKFAEVIGMLKSIKKDMTTTVDATDTKREEAAGVTEQKVPAVDQTLPTEVKAEKDGANGTTDENRESTPGTSDTTPAMDSSNPAGIKEEVESIKSMLKSIATELSNLKKTSEVDSSETKPKMEEKAETEDKDEVTDTTKQEDSSDKDEYKLPLPELNRAMKGIHSMDAFAAYISKTIQDMKDSFEKSGKRIVGLEQTIADLVRNDESIQKSIRGWINEPGQKKSIVMGSPYVFMKDGSRLKLIADDSYVAKSIDPKATFKDVYKVNFSSANDGK